MTRNTKPPIALYSALADVTRCRIIEILADGPIPVHRLADSFAISRPAISRHLRVLKDAGLVVEVKKGRENLYTFRARKLDKAVSWLNAFSAAQDEPEIEAETEGPLAEDVVVAAAPSVIEPPAAQPIIVPPKAEEKAASEPAQPAKPRAAKKLFQAPQPEQPDPISQMGFDF